MADPAIPGILALETDSFGRRDTGYFQVGAYVEHVPTGVFALRCLWPRGCGRHVLHGRKRDSSLVRPCSRSATFATSGLLVPEDNPDHWYLKAGLRERWSPFGHTVLYGEYAKRNDMISPGAIMATAADSFVANLGDRLTPDVHYHHR